MRLIQINRRGKKGVWYLHKLGTIKLKKKIIKKKNGENLQLWGKSWNYKKHETKTWKEKVKNNVKYTKDKIWQ